MNTLTNDLKQLADTAVANNKVLSDYSKDDYYIVVRKSDNKRLNSREYPSIGSAKLSIRHEFYGLRYTWADKTFGKSWWDISHAERELFEQQEKELYEYIYSLFEIRKVVV